MAKSDGSVIIDTRMDTDGFEKGVGAMNKQTANAQKGVNGLIKAVGKLGVAIGAAFAVKKLIQFGKEAIELGSDLQEVQNVVDVTFTTMSDKVNEFAQGAAEAAGLSETMAKKYVGTFGAMAKAFGFAEGEAFTMSTALTQLAGDVASFYNITQDEAYTKLKSVFTGETETLKDLGVVMTQNALDSYAMAEGYGKTTKQMSEQEKVALRYSFVLDQLSAAQGDFVRTSDSWANMTRVLSLNFDSLKANIGQALINIFTPFLKILNQIVSKMAELSKHFVAFSEMLVGKSTSGGGGSPGESLVEITDGFENITDATEEATKAQNKYFSGLDEIRTYSADKKNENNNFISPYIPQKTVSANNNTVSNISERLEEVANKIKRIIFEISNLFKKQDWEGLGSYVANGLNKGLKYIYDVFNWDKIGGKIIPVIESITKTFNSLVDGFDWQLLGQIIGSGINTVINSLNLFFEGVDWVNLGISIATGINGMFSEIDWENLGLFLGNKFMILWDTFKGFVSTIDYTSIGKSIGATINGALERIDLGQIIETMFQFAIGLLEILTEAVKKVNWKKVGQQIADALKAIDWIGLAKSLWEAGKALISGLLEAFGELPMPVQLVIDLFAGFLAASKVKEIVSFVTGVMVPAIKKLISTITENGGLVSAIKNLAGNLGTGGILALAIGGIVALVMLLVQNWDDVTKAMNKVGDFIKGTFTKAWTSLTSVLSSFGSFLKNTFTNLWDSVFNGKLSKILVNFFASCKTVFESVKKIFTSIINFISSTFSNGWKSAWGKISSVFSGVWTTMASVAATVLNVIIGIINGLIKSMNAVTGIIGMPKINSVQKINIPKLATGAVIPPNAPFMAILGDQKHGTNIEAPLDTIKQAVREVVGNNNFGGDVHIPISVDGNVLFDLMIKKAQLLQASTGKNKLVTL